MVDKWSDEVGVGEQGRKIKDEIIIGASFYREKGIDKE